MPDWLFYTICIYFLSNIVMFFMQNRKEEKTSKIKIVTTDDWLQDLGITVIILFFGTAIIGAILVYDLTLHRMVDLFKIKYLKKKTK